MKKLFISLLLVCFFSAPAFAVVNINTATQSELETLQGIGPAKARAIIEYREASGLFTSTEGLIEVDGIGPGTMKQIRDDITVGTAVDTETTTALAVPQE